MEKKFSTLRNIARFYQFLAVLTVLAGAIIGLLISIPVPGYPTNLAPGIVLFVGGLFTGLGMFVFSELIQVLLAIEENTRLTSQATVRLTKRDK